MISGCKSSFFCSFQVLHYFLFYKVSSGWCCSHNQMALTKMHAFQVKWFTALPLLIFQQRRRQIIEQKSSISIAGRSGSGQKGMCCWYAVRIVYCRRQLRINIQCLLLIRSKNMHYLLPMALFFCRHKCGLLSFSK